MTSNFIISTDLDGTLIDHHDYTFDAALPAIKRCQKLGIPIILNTSKTYSEVQDLQNKLDLKAPMIVENGSAMVFPNKQKKDQIFGALRSDVLQFIQQVRDKHEWKFEGFNDWSINQIASQTGLSIEGSTKANAKQYSEPFIWNDSSEALDEFKSLALASGLSLLKGGRFFHLQGLTDKAKPLAWLLEHYSELFPTVSKQRKLIALGDNHNDIAMLNTADIAVCVRSPVAEYPMLNTSATVIKTKKYGPEGWNEAVSKILDQHSLY